MRPSTLTSTMQCRRTDRLSRKSKTPLFLSASAGSSYPAHKGNDDNHDLRIEWTVCVSTRFRSNLEASFSKVNYSYIK